MKGGYYCVRKFQKRVMGKMAKISETQKKLYNRGDIIRWKYQMKNSPITLEATIQDSDGDLIYYYNGFAEEMYRKDGSLTTNSREMGK